MGERVGASDFECGTDADARQTGHFIQARQNWTKEDCENVTWSGDS